MTEAARWDTAVGPLLSAPDKALWRAHSDAVNAELLARWLPEKGCRRLLKTDLYDEAMGEGLYPLLAACARDVVGIDLSGSAVAAARARYPGLLALAGDVRCLPFASESFDVVVSNSTLDHFDTRREIGEALRQLHRVLVPGGLLLLTLDNLANPAVALRNALPFAWLNRLGLVPYPVGATVGPKQLKALLRDAAFEAGETAGLLHCPRALAVALAHRVQRAGDPRRKARLLRHLRSWERLSRWPTRFLTAYFVGVRARKPA